MSQKHLQPWLGSFVTIDTAVKRGLPSMTCETACPLALWEQLFILPPL